MLHAKLVAVGLATTMLAASGCGGSSKTTSASTASNTSAVSSTESGKPTTRAALIAKAEAICTRTRAQLAPLEIKTEKDYVRVLPQRATYVRIASNELSKLTPPSDMAHDWNQIIAGFNTYATDDAKVAERLEAHQRAAASALFVTFLKFDEKLRIKAKRAGFNECAQI